MNTDLPEYSARDRRAVLVAATAASFMTPFMGSSVNIALPRIGAELGMGTVQLGWVLNAFLLAAAVFLVPFSRLADLRGRKRIFGAGTLAFAVTAAACGLAPTAEWLLAARAFQGAVASMIFGTGAALLIEAYPPGERGRVLGINAAAVYIGLSLGPSVGGFLTQHLGWRSIFAAMTVLSLLMSALTLTIRADAPAADREGFDMKGASLYGVSLTMLVLGLTLVSHGYGVILAAAGVAGLALFVRRCASVPAPVLDVTLWRRSPVYAFSNLAALVHYSAISALAFLMSLYLQHVRNLAPHIAGLILVAQPGVMAVFSPVAGRISDRIEPRVVASLGMGISSAGLFALVMLGADTPVAWILAGLAMLGLAFALFSSPNTNAVMSSVDKRCFGVASGTLGTMRIVGGVMSISIATMLLGLRVGSLALDKADPAALLGGMRLCFAVFGCLCAAGVAASLARGNVRPSAEPAP